MISKIIIGLINIINSGCSDILSATVVSTANLTNPDGSTTVTVTNPDGSTTVTVTNPDGSTTVTVTNPDGLSWMD